MAWRIGVDIGGTFTDVALVDDTSGKIGVAKAPTTPKDFAQGVLSALAQAMDRYSIKSADVGLLSACLHSRFCVFLVLACRSHASSSCV